MNFRPGHVGPALVASLAGLALCGGCGSQVGIAASPAEIYVEVDGTAAVNVVAIMDTGSTSVVEAPLTISSNDEAIVEVSGQAVVGVAEGTAVLTITDGTFSTTATVNVVASGTLPTALVITPISISCTPASDDTQLEVFAVLIGGASEDVTDQASYHSSNSNIALVTAQGMVVCVGPGETAITAQYLGASGTVGVSVGGNPPRALNFSSSALTCAAGELHQVQVLASWDGGSTTDVTLSAAYSSSDEAVAVASLGQVQCLSEGSASIIADLAGVAGVLSVEVWSVSPDPDTVVGLLFNPSAVGCLAGGAAEFSVIAEYDDGHTVDVTGSARIQYQSSDSSVALVLQGQVFCLQQGQAIVQAAFDEQSASATISVW